MNGVPVWKSFSVGPGFTTYTFFPTCRPDSCYLLGCVYFVETAATDDASIIIQGAHFRPFKGLLGIHEHKTGKPCNKKSITWTESDLDDRTDWGFGVESRPRDRLRNEFHLKRRSEIVLQTPASALQNPWTKHGRTCSPIAPLSTKWAILDLERSLRKAQVSVEPRISSSRQSPLDSAR
jgi:hypothetical protein